VRRTHKAKTGMGSVFAALNPQTSSRDSILNHWTKGAYWQSLATGRAAIISVMHHYGARKIWLPSYICDDVYQALYLAGFEIDWYGVDQSLDVVIATLDQVAGGEAVLCVDYFGRSADEALRGLAARRQDVIWIEDRAQALSPEAASFGKAVIYSPRKLFGIGSGAIVVSQDPFEVAITDEVQADLWACHEARQSDPDGLRPQTWYSLFSQRENAFDGRARPMDLRSLEAINKAGWKKEAKRRRDNWASLAEGLSHWALWPLASVDFVPLSYPICVPDAAELVAKLAKDSIWCARHWSYLPSPERFIDAHHLKTRCLSLPLDGRYTHRDMRRLITAVTQL